MRKDKAIILLQELEESVPSLHLGINAFLEEPSSCNVPVDVGWKVLVDESVANLRNIKGIEEAAAARVGRAPPLVPSHATLPIC